MNFEELRGQARAIEQLIGRYAASIGPVLQSPEDLLDTDITKLDEDLKSIVATADRFFEAPEDENFGPVEKTEADDAVQRVIKVPDLGDVRLYYTPNLETENLDFAFMATYLPTDIESYGQVFNGHVYTDNLIWVVGDQDYHRRENAASLARQIRSEAESINELARVMFADF